MNSRIRQFAVVALALIAGSAVAAGLAHTAENDRPDKSLSLGIVKAHQRSGEL